MRCARCAPPARQAAPGSAQRRAGAESEPDLHGAHGDQHRRPPGAGRIAGLNPAGRLDLPGGPPRTRSRPSSPWPPRARPSRCRLPADRHHPRRRRPTASAGCPDDRPRASWVACAPALPMPRPNAGRRRGDRAARALPALRRGHRLLALARGPCAVLRRSRTMTTARRPGQAGDADGRDARGAGRRRHWRRASVWRPVDLQPVRA